MFWLRPFLWAHGYCFVEHFDTLLLDFASCISVWRLGVYIDDSKPANFDIRNDIQGLHLSSSNVFEYRVPRYFSASQKIERLAKFS